jgi:hypothetical protein
VSAAVQRTALTPAVVVFDPEDAYLARRETAGPHPRPRTALRYRLVAEVVGGARQDLPAPRELATATTPGGYHVFFGMIVLEDGSRRRLDLAAGTYVFRVDSEPARGWYQPYEVDVVLPAAGEIPVPLEPGPGYPFPLETLPNGHGPTLLRGAYLDTSGAGAADVKVEARVGGAVVSNECRTDESGQWVLVLPDSLAPVNVDVRIEPPGAAPITVAGINVVPGTTARLALTALRGSVLRAGGGGIEGARVLVQGRPGETRTSADGGWQYVFPPDQANVNVTVVAEVAGAPPQNRPNVAVQAQSTQPVPAFSF